MKTILFVHQSAELYGSDKTLLVLLRNLNKTNYKPVVILPSDGPLKQALGAEGADVFIAPVLKLHRSMFSPLNLLNFLKQIKYSLKIAAGLDRKYKFDLVYSNTLAVLLGMLFARRKKLKHIWHVHEIIKHPKIIAALFPWLLNKFADVVICNSYATQSNLTARVKSISKKSIVIYNGLDMQNVPTEVSLSKENIGFKKTDIVVTLVGRISRLKGHKLLLTAFYRHLSGTNIRLLFVGSPVPGQEYYLHEVENFIREHNISDKVVIMPFTKNLQPVWKLTDIAVMPSTEAESFGLVALEAMLNKKPVVGSNHGGLAEIIINNETGLLVKPGSEEELAHAIIKLSKSAVLRKEMGEKGYTRAVSDFSEAKYAAGIIKILDQI
jgi:glycosyltransferase involved in cell wall biosynthesis